MNAHYFREIVVAYLRYKPYADPESDRFDLGRVFELCVILPGPETEAQKIIKIKSWAADPIQPWHGEHKAEREKVLLYIEEQLKEVKRAS